jgi:DNA-binding HxlR family transcriptional regulator
MKLFIQLFIKSLKGASPAARFVFEMLAARTARTGGDLGGYKVDWLAQQFRLSQKLVRDALDELVQLNMVVRQSSVREGKGRPSIRYVFSPALVQVLTTGGPFSGSHAEMLNFLFSDVEIGSERPRPLPPSTKARIKVTKTGKSAPPGASRRLSACSRLLFATLLAHADHCGVVSGVGGPELRQLTGFDEASLKHRLRRLMDLGLIRRHVPGVSSSIFNTSRVTSTYFLNLNPGFGPPGDCAVMVHLAWSSESTGLTHVDILRSNVTAYTRSGKRSKVMAPLSVIRFLMGQQPRIYPVLQTMLYGYASFLLSHHWLALMDSVYLRDDKLYAMIEGDFRKPVPSLIGEGTAAEQASLDTEWAEVIKYFYRLTHEIAHEFRSRFGQATFLPLDAVQMSVFSGARGLGYEAIAMVVKSPPAGTKAFVWLKEERPGVVRLQPQTTESEVDLINRYDFGLLTRPKRSAAKE